MVPASMTSEEVTSDSLSAGLALQGSISHNSVKNFFQVGTMYLGDVPPHEEASRGLGRGNHSRVHWQREYLRYPQWPYHAANTHTKGL